MERKLYYAAADGFIMAVPVTPGSQWSAGAPAALFRVGQEIQNYDVTPDGSRFLVISSLDKVRESPLRVILNWTALLKSEK